MRRALAILTVMLFAAPGLAASLVATAPLAAAGSPPPGSTPFPKLTANGWYWFNDTTLTISSFIFLPSGVHIFFNNATIMFFGGANVNPELYSYTHTNNIVARDTTFVGSDEGWGTFAVTDGGFDGDRVTFHGAAVQLNGAHGIPVTLTHSSLIGPMEVDSQVSGALGSITDSLIYNMTSAQTADGEGFWLGDSALVENDTFVANDWALFLFGDNSIVRSCTFRFNAVAIHYGGFAGNVVTQNNFYDDYVAAVLNDDATGSIDASNNYWDGTPNAGGEATAGPVTTTNAASTPFTVDDQTSLLPFQLHSLRSGVWDAPSDLDGPVLAHSTVSVSGLNINAHKFRIGSDAQGKLSIASSTITDADMILSRGGDSYTGTTIRASVPGRDLAGILVKGNTPTISGDTFDSLRWGVVYLPVLPTDAPQPLTVQGSTFRNVTTAFQGGLVQPTIKGNIVTDADTAFFTGLSQSPSFDSNRIERVRNAYISVLDQNPTWTNDATYESMVDIYLQGSTTPTISGMEARYNAVDIAIGGSQVTLAGSNVMDCAGYCALAFDEVISSPLTGQTNDLTGSLTVAATSFLASPARGAVTFAPPARTTPTTTSAPAIGEPVTTVTSGQTLSLSGKLAGPVIVRSGGALRILSSSVDAQDHAILASPGAKVDIADSTIANADTVGIATSDARIDRSIFTAPRIAGLTIREAAPASLTQDSFIGGAAGITLYDAGATIERSWFNGTVGVEAYNTTTPTPQFHVNASLFETASFGVHGLGYPNATLTNDSFYKSAGINDEPDVYAFIAGGEKNHMDARSSWFGGGVYNGLTHLDGSSVPTETMIPSLPRPGLPIRAMLSGPAIATTAQPAVFTDASLDLDGQIVHRTFDFGDGTILTDPTSLAHQYTTPGTYTVRLNVTDTFNKWSLSNATVTVKAAPVAVASVPTAATSLDTLTFDGSASTDADGSVVAWRWQGSDGFDTGFTASPTATHAFAHPGTMKVTLTAKDNDGFESAPVASFVDVADRAPVASFSAPASGTRAAPVGVASTSTDADDSIATTAWDFGDGSSATGATASHTYATLGTYTIQLTVTDAAGNSTSASSVVSIVNAPPVVDFSANATRGRPAQPLTFTASASDPDGTPVDLAWDFGDGTTASGTVVQHTFDAEGTFNVSLTATDLDGASVTKTKPLIVSYNLPPIANFTFNVFSDARVVLADKSSDPDGRVVAWAWSFDDGATSTLASPTHRFLDAGTHLVTLIVTDDLGGTASLTRAVKVPDVLTATVGATLHGTSAMDADIVGAWINGTRTDANYTLRVSYFGPASAAALQTWTYTGKLGSDGEEHVSVSLPTAGAIAPGRYQLMLTLAARGSDGTTRTASSTTVVNASAT